MTIGERIKKRRKELGLTVDELAERLGKNRATVYRYESNEIEGLPTTVLEPLAEALQVHPAYLMGWKADVSNDNEGNFIIEGVKTQKKKERALITEANGMFIHPSNNKEFIIRGNGGIGKSTFLGTLSDKPPEVYRKRRPEILTYYDQLNDLGQQEAIKRVKELTQLPDYKK